jgi:hypothetical protein
VFMGVAPICPLVLVGLWSAPLTRGTLEFDQDRGDIAGPGFFARMAERGLKRPASAVRSRLWPPPPLHTFEHSDHRSDVATRSVEPMIGVDRYVPLISSGPWDSLG